MNLQGIIKKILKEETSKDLSPVLYKIINKMVVKNNQDIICGIKVTNPVNRVKLPQNIYDHEHYQVDVTVIWDYAGVKIPYHISKRYDSIIDDIWNSVYDFTGISVDIFITKVKECE
jgi:hypothetical protein